MNSLKAESPEIVAHYLAHEVEYSEISDALSIPRFSLDLMREISEILCSEGNARLVEAVSRLGDYGNASDHADMRKAVSKLLRKKGVKLPRGKRTKPELKNLVDRLTPLLLFFGLQPESNENSHLVEILRRIAQEFDVSGDPRDTLRSKIKTARIHQQNTQNVVFEAIRRGLSAPLN